MTQHHSFLNKAAVLAGTVAICAAFASAALPKATEIQKNMGFGWNLGNTMEAPGNPTSWGNSFPTKTLFDSVKAAGFTSVRIPTAWYSHADTTTNTINTAWLDSVKTVVDYCINDGLYCILNIHYDLGWLESRVRTADSAGVKARQTAFWKQIATKFKDYDEHLLFASANEPAMQNIDGTNDQSEFTAERMGILKGYHQAFVNVVRGIGGNNSTRTLIIQAPRTDEALAHSLLKSNMPTDPAGTGYLMAEFHFYPYQFSMMTQDQTWGNCYYYWGDGNYSTTDTAHNAIKHHYASPEYVDSVFTMLKTDFADQGIPLVIGEYAAIKRVSVLSGENLKLHLLSRVAFYHKVDSLSNAYGFVPFAWDTGAEGTDDNTIIRRQKGTLGSIYDYNVLNAMRRAYGLDTIKGNSIDALVKASLDTTNKSLQLTYATTRTDSSVTGTMRINVGGKDWSAYTGIAFNMKIDVASNGPLDGQSYGWTSVSVFAMSTSAWSWDDYNIPSTDITTSMTTYKVPFSELFTKGSASNVMAVGLNVYGSQLSGTVTINEVYLYKANGSVDTLATFNKTLPDIEGAATGVLVTTTEKTGIPTAKTANSSKFSFTNSAGKLSATFSAAKSGIAKVSLMNMLGQVLASRTVSANAGSNTVELSTGYRGAAILRIQCAGHSYTAKVNLGAEH